jgi:hypothetical protein
MAAMLMLREVGRQVRYASQILRRKVPAIELPPRPHLSETAMRHLEKSLASSSTLVEYGAGGSTLWFNALGARTISVDTSYSWCRAVAAALNVQQGENGSAVLFAYVGAVSSWGYPTLRQPPQLLQPLWANYIKRPWTELHRKGNKPTHVFVDGRLRVASLAYSAAQSLRINAQPKFFLDDFCSRSEEYSKVLSIFEIAEVADPTVELRLKQDTTVEDALRLYRNSVHDLR